MKAFLTLLVGTIGFPMFGLTDEEQVDVGELKRDYSTLVKSIEDMGRSIPYLCGFDYNRMLTTIREVEQMKLEDDSDLSQEDLEQAFGYTKKLEEIHLKRGALILLKGRAAEISQRLALLELK